MREFEPRQARPIRRHRLLAEIDARIDPETRLRGAGRVEAATSSAPRTPASMRGLFTDVSSAERALRIYEDSLRNVLGAGATRCPR